MTMSRLGWENRVGRTVATFGGYEAAGRGDGYLVPVIPKTDFSFDGRAGSTQDIPVATGIDSSSWVSGVVAVRMHAKSAWGAGTSVNVIVDNIMIVPEEPDLVFVSSTAVATVQFLEGTDSAPSFKVVALGAIGPMLRVRVRWSQSTAAAVQTVALGIDLVGRPA